MKTVNDMCAVCGCVIGTRQVNNSPWYPNDWRNVCEYCNNNESQDYIEEMLAIQNNRIDCEKRKNINNAGGCGCFDCPLLISDTCVNEMIE